MSDELDRLRLRHLLHKWIGEQRVIPFLGAGASYAGRAEGADWKRDGHAPSGDELRDWLVEQYLYPEDEKNQTLVRVAQFVRIEAGSDDLYRDLRSRFTQVDRPNVVHEYLAQEAARARAEQRPNPWPLIVTTNYDDLVETAFDACHVPYDVVTYVAKADEPGTFRMRTRNGRLKHIARRDRFAPNERSVILKLHGSVARRDEASDSYVITEDNYIAYMADDVLEQLPTSILRLLRNAHFLFLGYALEDWNVRVILFRLWKGRPRDARSVAIQKDPSPVDTEFWADHKVRIVDLPLEQWVQAMQQEDA
jgi:hypothetical protein